MVFPYIFKASQKGNIGGGRSEIVLLKQQAAIALRIYHSDIDIVEVNMQVQIVLCQQIHIEIAVFDFMVFLNGAHKLKC